MSTELYNLKFSGFQPNFLEKNLIHSCMMQVYEESPSDSYISVLLEKREKNYEGLLRVTSCKGLFETSAKSENLNTVLQSMCSDILNKVKDWKQKRFLEYVG